MKTTGKTTARVKKNAKKGVKKSTRRRMHDEVKEIIAAVETQLAGVAGYFGERPDLSSTDRSRMHGSGPRTYEFIEKTLDVCESNMVYAPVIFDRDTLGRLVAGIDELRGILDAVDRLRDTVYDHLLRDSDDAYRTALMYYNTVRNLARLGDAGAGEVSDTLRPFFANRGSARAAKETPVKKRSVRGAKDDTPAVKVKRRSAAWK